MERHPAVAGSFYEGTAARLAAQVAGCYEKAAVHADTKLPMIGAIVPHAGFIYSGHVAAELFASVELPTRFIILCPNHTGRGRGVAINSEGTWLTPMGRVRVDEPLAAELRSESAAFEEDSVAHAREHSLEVQLPLLQHLLGDEILEGGHLDRLRRDLVGEMGGDDDDALGIADHDIAREDRSIAAADRDVDVACPMQGKGGRGGRAVWVGGFCRFFRGMSA